MNHLYLISIPLNQTLVHHGRDAAIGVDPIPPKYDSVCTLAVDDEERGWDCQTQGYGAVYIT
jgi:hypothetical protein